MGYPLPPNQKLVNISWESNSLWVLTKPMSEDDVAETYNFGETSTLGILEGTITIYETKMNEEEYQQYLESMIYSYDYYKPGNLKYNEETGEIEKEIFIHYDEESNMYYKIQDYGIDIDGYLVPSY